MRTFYLIAGAAALAFFSAAQHQGWSVYSPRASQQLASSGASGSGGGFNRSSSLSHK